MHTRSMCRPQRVAVPRCLEVPRIVRFLIVAALFTLLARVTSAAELATNPDPATPAQAAKLLEVLKIRELISNKLAQVKQVTHAEIEQDFKGASQEIVAELNAACDSTMDQELGVLVDGMLQDAVILYQKHLTRREAEAAIAFYTSPEGASYASKAGAMFDDMERLTELRIQGRTQQLIEKLRTRFEKIMADHGIVPDGSNARNAS